MKHYAPLLVGTGIIAFAFLLSIGALYVGAKLLVCFFFCAR